LFDAACNTLQHTATAVYFFLFFYAAPPQAAEEGDWGLACKHCNTL